MGYFCRPRGSVKHWPKPNYSKPGRHSLDPVGVSQGLIELYRNADNLFCSYCGGISGVKLYVREGNKKSVYAWRGFAWVCLRCGQIDFDKPFVPSMEFDKTIKASVEWCRANR